MAGLCLIRSAGGVAGAHARPAPTPATSPARPLPITHSSSSRPTTCALIVESNQTLTARRGHGGITHNSFSETSGRKLALDLGRFGGRRRRGRRPAAAKVTCETNSSLHCHVTSWRVRERTLAVTKKANVAVVGMPRRRPSRDRRDANVAYAAAQNPIRPDLLFLFALIDNGNGEENIEINISIGTDSEGGGGGVSVIVIGRYEQ
ncbi:hypothetical protein EVAR_44853_1 [Eumeta japonica]|uniref:Uncharacterized protein n=1 Tax=Eumeta variegata TaxID=151549 RepID=A0A4C1YI69_EUMVA|nr:hypothetical protein EVAR_44853_1 [Eumeta japonica]